MLEDLLRLFKLVWDADERPEARQLTIGCFTVLILVALAGSIYFGIIW